MLYWDIETLSFFGDEHIKSLPRDQQLAAIRFGCAVTCHGKCFHLFRETISEIELLL